MVNEQELRNAVEDLEQSMLDLGEDAATLHAAAWRARVLPAAVGGLTMAALALGVSDQSLAYGQASPMPTDAALLETTGEAMEEAGKLAAWAYEVLAEAKGLLGVARRDYDEARTRKKAAAMEPDAKAAAAEMAAAARDMADAADRIGICEVAMDTSEEIYKRLTCAHGALEQLPADLYEAYEGPYQQIQEWGGRRIWEPSDWLGACTEGGT
jgi:hypothetical protein